MENPLPPAVTFEPPGPGHWELDTVHIQRPMTPFCAAMLPYGLRQGFTESSAQYGLMIDHMRIVPVHGFPYSQVIPFGLTSQGMLPPTHPDVQERLKRAEQALQDKHWREELRYWRDEVKPAAIQAHLALQDVEPTALDTPALTAHLRAITAHLQEMARLHHRFNLAHLVPVGDFLVHATAWTGKSAGDLARLLKGNSAVSTQLASREPPALVRALREDAAARDVLHSNDPAAHILQALQAMPGAVGERMREYLRDVGHRSLGYDISEPCVMEVPDALVRGLRGVVAGRAEEDTAAETRHQALMREAVPAEHRAAFDELLAEARLVYGLRDDRNTYTDGWAVGLARRAVLAVGQRLQAEGRLPDAALALDAGPEELEGLLAGASTPTIQELRRRAEWRMKTHTDVPPSLGTPPPPSPPMDKLPPAARRVNQAVFFYMGHMFGSPPAETTATTVKGLPVSPGVYEGTARVIREQTDLGRIEAGDVLIATTTSPYFNVVLPLLGALVTDRGGQLCHAAIVTREYGIPGIVGTRDATKLVRDGARVRVNGTTGELQVLS
ncbi:PEP-utilizing enzyme [Archangium primigenium]|uniref:PEP-utilizing enzyme n=1 Tax=[Archangium] primigenium TaxID=2792470 RepID=UPI001957E11E